MLLSAQRVPRIFNTYGPRMRADGGRIVSQASQEGGDNRAPEGTRQPPTAGHRSRIRRPRYIFVRCPVGV
jgi:hypothetical protein